jgi:hypothetical protein
MRTAAIEPDLFVIEREGEESVEHIDARTSALLMHITTAEELGQKVAMSDAYYEAIFQLRPWRDFSTCGRKFNDYCHAVYSLLPKIHQNIPDDHDCHIAGMEPSNLVCNHITNTDLIDAWSELLESLLADARKNNYLAVLTTWERGGPMIDSLLVHLEFSEEPREETLQMPIVYDRTGWFEVIEPFEKTMPRKARRAERRGISLRGDHHRSVRLQQFCESIYERFEYITLIESIPMAVQLPRNGEFREITRNNRTIIASYFNDERSPSTIRIATTADLVTDERLSSIMRKSAVIDLNKVMNR